MRRSPTSHGDSRLRPHNCGALKGRSRKRYAFNHRGVALHIGLIDHLVSEDQMANEFEGLISKISANQHRKLPIVQAIGTVAAKARAMCISSTLHRSTGLPLARRNQRTSGFFPSTLRSVCHRFATLMESPST